MFSSVNLIKTKLQNCGASLNVAQVARAGGCLVHVQYVLKDNLKPLWSANILYGVSGSD